MKKSTRNIIAIFIIVIPFYLIVILQKALGLVEISVQTLFIEYLPLTILGILIILLINKYFLKNPFTVFVKQRNSIIVDIALGFLLLVLAYFVFSLGNITFAQWFPTKIDRTQILSTLNTIFSNHFLALIFIGPFIWISEIFMALSRAFILNNLWDLSSKKTCIWASIITTGLLCSLTQIDNGIPAMLNWFLIFTASNILYYKYRSIYPQIIAGILLQTIELVGFWIHVL